MSDIGNSNRIAREYLDSLWIETRYMDSDNPILDFELYGTKAATPIMTAALSHLDHFMYPGAAEALAKGAKEAGAILWYGMAEEEKLGLLAVGIDIDHPFADDGSPDHVSGYEMRALRTEELREICRGTDLPVIIKGVLSTRDAERCLGAGARGLVLSHHNNRIEYAIPPMALLPEIVKMTNGQAPVFVDCEIKTGMDAFKALALGAKGVCIGRPLMTAIKQDGDNGVRDYLVKATSELRKAMAYTGCTTLEKMDPTVIHHHCMVKLLN